MSLSREKRQRDGKQEGKPKPQSTWEQEHLSERQLLLFGANPGRAAGAPVLVGERWHIFEGRKQSFQQLEQHTKINPRFLAGPFPSAVWVPARRTPARGSPGRSSPANSLCMGEIPSATEVIISQQEPTISFHLGTNLNNVRGRGREGTRCSGAFDKSGQEPNQREKQTSR